MISGICDPQFSQVRDEFVRNFSERGEVGACVSIVVDGRPRVDLWGGVADPVIGRAWEEDTVCVVWSCTKGATSLAAHLLLARGQLELEAPVSTYWPEYGVAGKEHTTVAHVLGHRAGLPAVRGQLPDGAFFDWELMVDTLAGQEPFYDPGSRHGYHGVTFGWLVGEIVRRVSGKSLGSYFRSEIAEPLGLDFWIGAPPEVSQRSARVSFATPDPDVPVSEFFRLASTDPTSIPALLFNNTGGYFAPGAGGFDSREAHAAELGATGAMTNARGLSGLYTPVSLDGTCNGIKLFTNDDIGRMSTTMSAGHDDSLRSDNRFTAGFQKAVDNRRKPVTEQDSVIIGPNAFGHSGFGGSLGFADPDHRIAFGYTMNQMGTGTGLNPRGQSLVDATYRALGATSDASGAWR